MKFKYLLILLISTVVFGSCLQKSNQQWWQVEYESDNRLIKLGFSKEVVGFETQAGDNDYMETGAFVNTFYDTVVRFKKVSETEVEKAVYIKISESIEIQDTLGYLGNIRSDIFTATKDINLWKLCKKDQTMYCFDVIFLQKYIVLLRNTEINYNSFY